MHLQSILSPARVNKKNASHQEPKKIAGGSTLANTLASAAGFRFSELIDHGEIRWVLSVDLAASLRGRSWGRLNTPVSSILRRVGWMYPLALGMVTMAVACHSHLRSTLDIFGRWNLECSVPPITQIDFMPLSNPLCLMRRTSDHKSEMYGILSDNHFPSGAKLDIDF